jgi:hypothetical protein
VRKSLCYFSFAAIAANSFCVAAHLILVDETIVLTVISGFNTDIEHGGVTYHVQTEDKGLDTPLILSLVYTGGEILASKRATYDDLIASGFEETALADRLHRQHKLICAAIVAGRIDDLKRMSEKEAVSRAESKSAFSDVGKIQPQIEKIDFFEPVEKEKPIGIPVEEVAPIITVPISNIVREVVPDFAKSEDEAKDEMTVSLIEETPLKGGDRVMLKVLVSHGNDEKHGIAGAEVLVKVLGSTFRPLIFQSRTGPNGIATIRMQLPHFTTGRAAVLVRATTDEHEAELRRIINQG